MGKSLHQARWPQIQRFIADIRGQIARGDMMIGILSIDEVAQVPALLRRAAEAGAGEAWLALAEWLDEPPYGPPDVDAAAEALGRALAEGVPGAALRLAALRWFSQRQSLGEEQRRETYQMLQQLVAANPDDARAIHLLGLLTCQGFGVDADPQAALALQRRAADLGESSAMFELYVHYATGLGTPIDELRAYAANAAAAQLGHPRALYNIGAFHATGWVVAQDMMAAATWYERAAQADNPHAMVALAAMCAHGHGVPQDRARASALLDWAEYLGEDVVALRDDLGLAN